MIFITGGMAQGKTAFAESLNLPIVDNLEVKIRAWLIQMMEQGLGSPATECMIQDKNMLHDYLFSKIKEEVYLTCESQKKECIQDSDVVLILREIGCGIVPVEKVESIWREVSGRLACTIAGLAKDVYKLESGIAVKIK